MDSNLRILQRLYYSGTIDADRYIRALERSMAGASSPLPTIIIPDNNLEQLWVCPDCSYSITLEPSFCSNSGNPVCDCESDMEYVHTRLR